MIQLCTTWGCGEEASRLTTCEGVGAYAYCVECADVLTAGPMGELDLGPVLTESDEGDDYGP